jgi:guanylate kinase
MESKMDLAQKIATFIPSETELDSVRNIRLLLAVGVSGAGKDTILGKLMKQYPDEYAFMVSHSTRKPRYNDGVMEQDGVKYHFIDTATAHEMLDTKKLLEANYYASNFYATSIAELHRASQGGKILVSDIDVNGIANYMGLRMNAKPVFILPPSYAVWRERLQRRYHGVVINHDDLRQRIQTALDETREAIVKDYYYIVINDDLEEAVRLIDEIAHDRNDIPHHTPESLACAQQFADDLASALAHEL